MTINDTLKFEVETDDQTKRFVVKRSRSATSRGFKLFGYDPAENSLNLLEDFGVSNSRSRSHVVTEARKRIRFYVEDNSVIRSPGEL